MRIQRPLVFALMWLVLIVLPANAQSHKQSALRGISSTGVVIEELPADAQRGGLNGEQLRTDVELRLRKAGVRIDNDKANSFLYVRVYAIKNEQCGGFYVLTVEVELDRSATIDIGKGRQSPEVLGAWSKTGLAVLPLKDFVADARTMVGDICDQFLNDYLAANPKP